MKVIIFDVDGTLVDTVAIHAETRQKAFREFDYEIDFDELRAKLGKGGDELMPSFTTAWRHFPGRSCDSEKPPDSMPMVRNPTFAAASGIIRRTTP